MPTVSVVIPCFNYAEHLEDAVVSVLAQTYRDLEVIVVNDGSTDRSLEVANLLAAAHPRVQVLDQPNAGQPAITRNNGIARASGRYILCLDADDMIGATMVEECVALLDADPGLGVAYPVQQNFGANDDGPLFSGWDGLRLPYANRLPVASVYRREAWEAVGGYRTNVRGYEDWDFWIAISSHGWRGELAARATFLYRVHGEGVYASTSGSDPRLKAQIVMNRPALYTEQAVVWAQGILAEDPAMLAIETPVGIIPGFAERPRPAGVRSFAAIAFAEEIVADPGLLAAYGREFSAGDDATLVIVAPDAADRLVEAVAAAGVDGEGSADLLAMSEPPRGLDALYSRREPPPKLVGLPAFDDSTVEGLRRMMERRLTAPKPLLAAA